MHRLARRKCRACSGQRFEASGRTYEFMGAIGDGAVGLVRKARDLSDNRTVAVKILRRTQNISTLTLLMMLSNGSNGKVSGVLSCATQILSRSLHMRKTRMAVALPNGM